jgi:hypothetical protein
MRCLAQSFGPNASAFDRTKCIATASLTVAIFAALPLSLQAKTAAAPTISVDGSAVSVPALERSNTAFVPVRGVFEKLGAAVDYNAPDSIVARKNGHTLANLRVGSRAATVAGTPQTLAVAPFAANGHVMVPLRLISEAAGATVAYAASPRSIQIHRAVAAAAAVPVTAAAVAVAAPVVASVESADPAAAVNAAPATEERHGIPWWVWLLLALIALGIIFALMRRKKEPIITTTSGRRSGPDIKTRR